MKGTDMIKYEKIHTEESASFLTKPQPQDKDDRRQPMKICFKIKIFCRTVVLA